MRKSIIKIVLWSLALLVCLAIMVVAMATNEEGASFMILNLTYKDAELYTAGNTEHSTDTVSSLKIDYRQGTVKIVKYDGDTVNLVETGADSEENAVHTRLLNGTLHVKFSKSKVSFFEGIPNKTLTIYIPKSLDTVEIDTASADVTLDNIRAKKLDFDSASGQVTAVLAAFDEVDIDTASGSVTLSMVDVDDVAIDTASGNVSLSGKFGEVEIDTASGDAELSGEVNNFEMDTASGDANIFAAPKRLSFDSASGDITVRLPVGTVGVSAVHDAASGEMTVIRDGREIEGNRYNEQGTVNHVFEFDTASGDVDIIFEN
ncbi:MAG: DUF4097 family beta strand repeat protein [Clostridia bacterium]|nr:DUF4097 family beta strand repeat protein [Clostridia bacterium]MBQ8289877.1 DUF4097 family beta strand repeat protein [Clostridia bacterium]